MLKHRLNGCIHINGRETFWSLLKSGLKGTYVSVEPSDFFATLTNRLALPQPQRHGRCRQIRWRHATDRRTSISLQGTDREKGRNGGNVLSVGTVGSGFPLLFWAGPVWVEWRFFAVLPDPFLDFRMRHLNNGFYCGLKTFHAAGPSWYSVARFIGSGWHNHL